jgi:hypothetical protein
MSRIRDIANLFSTNTDAATDAEVTSAVNTHAAGSTTRHFKAGNSSSRPVSPTLGDLYSNTETGFMEVYSGSTYGWESIGSAASTPTGVTATNQGSGRDYNNGQASVAFTAGSIVGRSYTVTSNPGGFTGSGTSSPITVTGLQSGQSYTYTVTATNNYGTSAESSASAGVTATTVPQAPTIGTATGADSSATLTFTAGATGGSSITNYKYSTDNSTYTAFSPEQTSSPLTISGLTNGQSYSFYLKSVNANGDSAASAASNSIVPALSGSFESIATYEVGAGGQAYVEFTSIPQTYTHLQIRGLVKFSGTSDINIFVGNNSVDTGANYAYHSTYGSGTSVANFSEASTTYGVYLGYYFSTSTNFAPFVLDILDYKNTNKYKTFRTIEGTDTNAAGIAMLSSSLWLNTSPINTIRLYSKDGTSLTQYSRISLYGIRSE